MPSPSKQGKLLAINTWESFIRRFGTISLECSETRVTNVTN
jgi:hypothetical protein